MKTSVLPAGDAASLPEAARIIREGGLVAYPTDTLYGLGAHCWQPAALRRVFEAKGRLANQPLPVLLARAEDALELADDPPADFWRFALRFWPGALTLVLRKKRRVPAEISARGQTVALRVPAHPTALALIGLVGAPITGTSANRSGEPSPRSADDVLRQLGGEIDAIVDGGPSPLGVESTILDLTSARPRLLRRGAIALAELQDALGAAIES